MTSKKQTDELRKLKARVEELERAAKPPEPFKPELWEPTDYTSRMSMPASAMREMVNAIPSDVVRNIALRDARAPVGPSSQGVIPSSQQLTGIRAGGGSGWAREIPLSPPPGVAQADRLMDAQDQRDRAELIARDAKLKAMQKLAEPKRG
jgi:hypothetical protein